MSVRKAEAVWEGSLKEGKGRMKVGSGGLEGPFSFASRFEAEAGSNPEELIGAAHAGCFSMFLSALLDKKGHPPEKVSTEARVHLGKDDQGPKITKIELHCEAEVPGINDGQFQELAEQSKTGCPISRALGSTEISLTARLRK